MSEWATFLFADITSASSPTLPTGQNDLVSSALRRVRKAIEAEGGEVRIIAGDFVVGVFAEKAGATSPAARGVRAAQQVRESLEELRLRIPSARNLLEPRLVLSSSEVEDERVGDLVEHVMASMSGPDIGWLEHVVRSGEVIVDRDTMKEARTDPISSLKGRKSRLGSRFVGVAAPTAFESLEDALVLEALEAPESAGGRGTETLLRYLNVSVTRPSGKTVPRTQPLTPRGRYRLRLNIGDLATDSIVENPTAHRFPADLLPSSPIGHWLQVVAASEDIDLPESRHFLFLPVMGSSWVCPCEPFGEHVCDSSSRERHLFIRLRTTSKPANEIRLGVYYERNLLQSQRIHLRVGDSPEEEVAQRAEIDFTLNGALSDFEYLAPREMNILVNHSRDGGNRVVINGKDHDPITLTLGPGQMTNASAGARELLFEVHFEELGGGPGTGGPMYQSRFDDDHAKNQEDFLKDLEALARQGRVLWNALRGDQPKNWESLRKGLLRSLAKIQVCRVKGTDVVFPWSAVYDLPLEPGAPEYIHCPLVEGWDGFADAIQSWPEVCPFDESHVRNTLCPFGFWGYRHHIEQPPSVDGRTIRTSISTRGGTAAITVGRSVDLKPELTLEHMEALKGSLADFQLQDCTSREAVEEALTKDELELLYFYCHGKNESLADAAKPIPFLEIGETDRIYPEDLETWSVDWSDRHWNEVSPLVFLNGCHTTDLTPESLTSFVDTLVRVCDATGLIGTEISIDQKLASEAAQTFFAQLTALDERKRPTTVGEALRRTRLHLLAKGNLIGLAYTPFCSADLHLKRSKSKEGRKG